MKKIIVLIILLVNFIGNAQCSTPSNLTSSGGLGQTTLSWTENGTASAWDIAVVPDFYVGAALPSNGWISATTNPFIVTGLPPAYGCYVFLVRSVCSATNVSPWIAVGSLGCSTNVYNYLATLSNDTFNSENHGLQLFPNPSKNVIQIKINSKIDKITIFDYLGKEILTQTQHNNEINVENLSKGIYLIEVLTENEKNYRQFIKE
ncbi:MAG: T9SS type A sorting domain-containing protein [Flavobacterium sp.]